MIDGIIKEAIELYNLCHTVKENFNYLETAQGRKVVTKFLHACKDEIDGFTGRQQDKLIESKKFLTLVESIYNNVCSFLRGEAVAHTLDTIIPKESGALSAQNSARYITEYTQLGEDPPIPEGVDSIYLSSGDLSFINGTCMINGPHGTLAYPEVLKKFIERCGKHSPPIKIYFTVRGDYGGSWNFLNSDNVASFSRALMTFCRENGLSGIDFVYEPAVHMPDQASLVGELIKTLKSMNPDIETSLCTNFGLEGGDGRELFNAAKKEDGTLSIDRLNLNTFYPSIEELKESVNSWIEWIAQNYGMDPSHITVAMNGGAALDKDLIDFANWTSQRGVSTSMWNWNPASAAESNAASKGIWNACHGTAKSFRACNLALRKKLSELKMIRGSSKTDALVQCVERVESYLSLSPFRIWGEYTASDVDKDPAMFVDDLPQDHSITDLSLDVMKLNADGSIIVSDPWASVHAGRGCLENIEIFKHHGKFSEVAFSLGKSIEEKEALKTIARSKKLIEKLAHNILAISEQYGFDRLDLNLDIGDREASIALLSTLRKIFQREKSNIKLAIKLPHTHFKSAFNKYVDYIVLTIAPGQNIYSLKKCIRYCLQKGINPSKIILATTSHSKLPTITNLAKTSSLLGVSFDNLHKDYMKKWQGIEGVNNMIYTSTATTGSMLTTAQEASRLASNSVVASLIQTASSQYQTQLTAYRANSISFSVLQSSYQSIFSQLLSSIQTAIANDTTGSIAPIAGDYDSAHAEEYLTHLNTLIGLAQNQLNIPAYLCILPPDPSYANLIANGDFSQGTTGWKVTSGSGVAQSYPPGTYDTSSPVANENSLSFSNVPAKPGYMSVSQSVLTTPGHTYLVSAYVMGTPAAGSSVCTGGFSVDGARSFTSSTTGKTISFPQNSNELDQEGWHRRYFWVEATDTFMTLNLSGANNTVFKNVGIFDVSSMNPLDVANAVCPPVSTIGPPEVGHFPQVEAALSYGENLLDGDISIQDNIDQSALKNSGHPYWYFDAHNPANADIQITNALNGAHGLSMPKNASVTTNGPVGCPAGQYTYSMQIYLPEDSDGKVAVQFGGVILANNQQLPTVSQTFEGLEAGQVNTVQLTIDATEFATLPEGTFFRPAVTITNLGDTAVIFDTQLTSDDNSIYDQINSINPYSRSIWNATPTTYDFTQGSISRDWGIALTGNTMFAPGAPATDYTVQTPSGIQIISNRDNTQTTPYANGGIQSTQLLPSGQNFNLAMQFVATTEDPTYEPTLAVWAYGESQRGPDNPLYHTNAPGADVITEFDCEMGSDSGTNVAPPAGSLYIRDGSYIGYAEGGHSEYTDVDAEGNSIWKEVPDFWDGKPHTLTMQGVYNSEGHLILTRSLDGIAFSTQDVGPGPFSPMYIKVALENPNWNSRGKGNGTASVLIQNMAVSTSPPTGLSPGVVIPTVPLDQVDYTWFTPGGGGSPSYTPFAGSVT